MNRLPPPVVWKLDCVTQAFVAPHKLLGLVAGLPDKVHARFCTMGYLNPWVARQVKGLAGRSWEMRGGIFLDVGGRAHFVRAILGALEAAARVKELIGTRSGPVRGPSSGAGGNGLRCSPSQRGAE
jgi:hypothetical protein